MMSAVCGLLAGAGICCFFCAQIIIIASLPLMGRVLGGRQGRARRCYDEERVDTVSPMFVVLLQKIIS